MARTAGNSGLSWGRKERNYIGHSVSPAPIYQLHLPTLLQWIIITASTVPWILDAQYLEGQHAVRMVGDLNVCRVLLSASAVQKSVQQQNSGIVKVQPQVKTMASNRIAQPSQISTLITPLLFPFIHSSHRYCIVVWCTARFYRTSSFKTTDTTGTIQPKEATFQSLGKLKPSVDYVQYKRNSLGFFHVGQDVPDGVIGSLVGEVMGLFWSEY